MSTKREILDLMIDCETTGVSNTPGILTIGCVPFGIRERWLNVPGFYIRINPEDLKANGFREDPNTMKWWSEQDPLVRMEAFGGRESVIDGLLGFATYLNNLKMDYNCELAGWSYGASADMVWLTDAYDHVGMPFPISYRNHRCFRTLKSLFPQIAAPKFSGNPHDAYHDAMHQAEHADLILEHMRNRSYV